MTDSLPAPLQPSTIKVLALGVLGYRFEAGVVEDPFNSHIAFRDYDVVLIDAAPFVQKYLGREITAAEKSIVMDALERRAQDLDEFLKLGRIAIVVANPAATIVWNDAPGRRRESTLEFPKLGLSQHFERSDGHTFDVKGTGPEISFLAAVRGRMSYKALFRKYFGKAALVAPGGAIVGCVDAVSTGLLVVGPEINPGTSLPKTVSLLRTLVDGHRAVAKIVALPAWTNSVIIKGESEAIAAEAGLSADLSKIQRALVAASSAREALQARKHLFASKGDPLLSAASDALTRLGFSISPGPEGRDDLVATAPDGRVMVVEVKGRDNKPAAEADCAQLEKWVSRYFEENDTKAKGLLIFNAYATQPLSERSEESFPNQMLDYAQRRQHCLVSGIQLMCLVESQDERSRDSAVSELFSCEGVFPRFRGREDWLKCITTTVRA